MSRETLIFMMRRTLAHLKAGTLPQAKGIHRVPADHYTSPQRFRLEVDRVYRRLPLALALSCELGEPGSFRTTEVVGMPLLIVRGSDGEARAFVNACSHRGAMVESRDAGRTSGFVCPYHAWNYNTEGELVRIFDEEHFGAIDRSSHGLVRLPTAERAGLIFVTLDPEPKVDVDAFLTGFDGMLEHSRLGERHFLQRFSFAGPNWKAAYDGYIDFYHLPILHKESFGNAYSHRAVYDAWGPHVRTGGVEPALLGLAEVPEENWETDQLIQGVWNLFPGGAIVTFDAGAGVQITQVNQVFPGPSVSESWTEISFLSSVADPDEEQRKALQAMVELLLGVVQRDDYPTVHGIYRALASGAQRGVLFGRNEEGAQRFHHWMDRLVEAETPDQLRQLFDSAEIYHQA